MLSFVTAAIAFVAVAIAYRRLQVARQAHAADVFAKAAPLLGNDDTRVRRAGLLILANLYEDDPAAYGALVLVEDYIEDVSDTYELLRIERLLPRGQMRAIATRKRKEPR